MQIHELNTFAGKPGNTDFLAIDSQFDTAKISAEKLLEVKVNQPIDEHNQLDYGNDGQLLRSKGDGSTEWSDVGQPTDAQIAQAINDWLSAHPEATTTVLDGSLTEAKFSSALKLKAIKDYVTPEMYGAVGDGVTDDTVALQSCIQSGKMALLTGTYKITNRLDFTDIHDFVMFGGKITREANQTFNTIRGQNCNNILIENVIFDGNGNDRGTSYSWIDNVQACIILASQSKNIFIEKCKILNHNYGIFILGADVENAPTNYDNTSFEGVIRDCVFHNCHSAIDTYGKATLIDHNVFYDITEQAIQIEPNYNASVTDNPLNDPVYYTAAVASVISNNLIISVEGLAILAHVKNNYAAQILNNTIIDFTSEAIAVNGTTCKGVIIKGNALYYQRPQTVDESTRPWTYKAAIYIDSESIVSDNYIWKADIGIATGGGEIVSNNYIDSPRISGILQQLRAGLENEISIFSNNKIRNHIFNTAGWWGSRAIVLGASKNTFLFNNVVDSDRQPIYISPGSKAKISGLVSTVAETDTITAPSGFNVYSN